MSTADALNWPAVLHFADHGNPKPPRRDERSEAAWREILTDEQFRVARSKGTERPHSSNMCSLFTAGRYACVCCNTELFNSTEKFDSRTGWPSFTKPASGDVIGYHSDASHGMRRVEVTCNVCDAHLGHVFPDGPGPTRLRYCINGVSLTKLPEGKAPVKTPKPNSRRFDKVSLKSKLLALEHELIGQNEARFKDFAKAAKLDVSAVRDDQDGSQARQNSVLAAGIERQIHEHTHHQEQLAGISFDPKSLVEAGAIVSLSGRHFVVAVPTPVFEFDGVEMMGVSVDSPLARGMLGLSAGDEFTLGSVTHSIDQVW